MRSASSPRRAACGARRLAGARTGPPISSRLRPLLAEPRTRLEPSGFPRLAGRYSGHAVDVQAVPDALTFRKLPALWLLVTLTEPQPLAGETRIMVRPSGLEPFSTFAPAAHRDRAAAGLSRALRRADDRAGPSAARPVWPALAPLLEDPALKEIVLSPAGLRLVRLAEEAPKGAYLLFREADLGRTPVSAAVVQRMLETLTSSRESSPVPRPARWRQAMPDRRPPHPWLVLARRAAAAGMRPGDEPPAAAGPHLSVLHAAPWRIHPRDRGPGVSLVGKLAGGLFVYAMAILDAYRTARLRWEIWQHAQLKVT